VYQVQWGRKGRWKRQEFADRRVATEFCKKTVNECTGMEKVILIEQNPTTGDQHVVMSMEGLK
jgi:hypothetical protein